MPIFIKDFSWRQTSHSVFIRLPLKGVNLAKTDISVIENYLKVHCPPFFFEVFLAHPVKAGKTKCTAVQNELIFEIVKEEVKEWDSLEMELSKDEKTSLREKLLENQRKESIKEFSLKIKKKSAREKLTVNEQINLNAQSQRKIEEIREQEKKIALEDLETWQRNDPEGDKDGETRIFSKEPSKEEDEDDLNLKTKVIEEKLGKSEQGKTISENVESSGKREYKRIKPVPLVRDFSKIDVDFTPREFVTPSRESKLPEEEEWLQKQATARRATGFISNDLRPEECDPQWLNEKGNSFFKNGNYLGAISAYSHGIKLCNKLPTLYSNRSAAHLALNNLHKAAEDASKALELLKPTVEANKELRIKAHIRRGSALCKLGVLNYGLLDYEEAFKLNPKDETLKADMENIRLLIKQEHESD